MCTSAYRRATQNCDFWQEIPPIPLFEGGIGGPMRRLAFGQPHDLRICMSAVPTARCGGGQPLPKSGIGTFSCQKSRNRVARGCAASFWPPRNGRKTTGEVINQCFPKESPTKSYLSSRFCAYLPMSVGRRAAPCDSKSPSWAFAIGSSVRGAMALLAQSSGSWGIRSLRCACAGGCPCV